MSLALDQEQGRFFINIDGVLLPFLDAHRFDDLMRAGDVTGYA